MNDEAKAKEFEILSDVVDPIIRLITFEPTVLRWQRKALVSYCALTTYIH